MDVICLNEVRWTNEGYFYSEDSTALVSSAMDEKMELEEWQSF